MITQLISPKGTFLPESKVVDRLSSTLGGRFTQQRVLVLVPDHTRSLPLPFLFKALVDILQDSKQLDFMVALGTHAALTETELEQLFGISKQDRLTKYKKIGLLNHVWNDPSSLTSLGIIEKDEIKQIAREYWHPSLPDRVEISINKAILAYDHILILGPTFPHEVVGFSGGAKYLFPGISSAEMINATHWLGALAGVIKTIGIKNTPVREMINVASKKIPTPITLIAFIVDGNDINSLFVGDLFSAWNAAADLSAERHIRWCEKPFQRVLSCAPTMYDDLWTAGKAMYKLEPVMAVGGEVVIFAPHLDSISRVHGKYIYEVGYHILPYFLQDWDRFKHIPLSILAHSTHVRGSGVVQDGVEKPNIKVTLASRVSPEDCAKLNLGYQNPDNIKISDWQNQEDKGILVVPKAGEILYRVKN
jgi:nickel-dependent lactate racemase